MIDALFPHHNKCASIKNLINITSQDAWSLTLLVHRIPPPSLQVNSKSSAQCLVAGYYNCYCNLLDEEYVGENHSTADPRQLSSVSMDWLLGNLHGNQLKPLNVATVMWTDLLMGEADSGMSTYPRCMNWLFGTHSLGGIPC